MKLHNRYHDFHILSALNVAF